MAFSRVDELANEFERVAAELHGIVAVFLFGSALRKAEPRDADLVVVYGPPLTPATAPIVTGAVEDAVRKVFGLPAHLMFLTEREALELRQSARTEWRLLFGACET